LICVRRLMRRGGGNTDIAEMRAAPYDALDPETTAEIEDLVAQALAVFLQGAARLDRFHAGRAGEVCAGAPAQVPHVIQSNRTGLSATRHTAALARLSGPAGLPLPPLARIASTGR
jgi:hypothetical protein